MIPKILFIDLDGTLLDKGFGVWAKMSNVNRKQVLEFSKTGIVVISTGRVFNSEVRKISRSVNAKYTICQNGSIILDENFNELSNLAINQDLVTTVTDIIKDYKLTFSGNPGNYLYGRGFWNKIFCLFSHFKPKKYLNFKTRELNKILVIGHSKRKIKKLSNFLQEKLNDQINIKIVGKNYAIEITRKDCSKGIAACKIAKYLNIDLSETVHIGDSMNDSSTKGIVGKLIAMKSGSKRLKKMADEIGPRKHNAGVAKIIKSFK
ncbi:HAD-IIB family hydrolase [Mesomycoplasma lagogenitalium]|uniref:HAD-IIB family hydrolase n=1 Tax=Mesomycoplasma lagogenitalium TaxID=171286 RepID=A0ABY8LVZ4_9BACT|nr:HAD-IIB family hydrolase [Mesomycoplasma lagogenitalium]WGI36453.1 HAD-IIB family hydrolase [Mesomycoplasma lagogenitalium]